MTTDGDGTGSGLDLIAPEPASVVDPAAVEREVPVKPEAEARVDALVRAFVDDVVAVDIHSEEYRGRVTDVNGIGAREIAATSQMSNRLLDRPAAAMTTTLGGKSPLTKNLVDLRHTVEDLNPAKYDLHQQGSRKVLGVIPFGNRVRAYFDRYAKAQKHIEGIVGSLEEGRSELQLDNAAIDQEQRSLWTQIETLRQYALMAERLDGALEGRIASLDGTDPGHARALREDILFPVRRRRQDILTQLAVASQGYAALRVVQKNNEELIRAVQIATTTTVAALRTAVMVAQALTTQHVVVEQLKAVNEVTSGMIESTSTMLRDQTGEVEARATSPGVDIDALQRSWNNVFAALDQIDRYKLEALASMKVTISELTNQVGRSQTYLDRLAQDDETPGQVRPGREPDSRLRLS